MTKVFFKFKKPYFWPIFSHFPNFWGQNTTWINIYKLIEKSNLVVLVLRSAKRSKSPQYYSKSAQIHSRSSQLV